MEIFGVERAELLSMGLNDLWSIPRQDHQETTLSDHFQRAATDGMTSTEECCQRASGERFWVEFKFKPIEVKGRSLVLTQARDITDRRRYEQTLSALHTAVTDIVAADQSRQVTGSVLSTVDNLLAADRGAVFRHVSSKNWLEVVDAMSLPSVASEVPLDPDHPLARAFIDGRPIEVDDVSTFGSAAGDDTGHGLTLFMPIGSAGVLAIGYDDRRSVAPHDSEFVEILANAAAAAFERFEREQEINSGQQEISRQSEELHRLERVNATLRGLNESLLRAETRDEIFEAVCDQVSDIEGVKLAWIGVPTEESVLDRRAWAGNIPQYLDNITLELDSSEEPAIVAFQTGRSVRVANTAIDIRQQPWKQTALSYGVESVVAIPIEVDGVTSGVLSVLSADQNAFSGRFERMLSAIASSVGETLQSVEQRHALQSGATTELAFEIDGVDHLFGRLAADADCELDVTGVIPEPGATCRVFAAVEEASLKSVTEVAATMSAVRSATIATDNGPDGVVELHLETPLLGAQLREYPVRISELSASPNSVQVGLEIAQTDILRDVASDILDRYPSAQLVSKGTQNADGSDYERLVAFRESLTTRQREVVHTAYLNGYFQSPRHCTGKELGEKLGISSQAVYQHLRAAERQLFDEAFRQTRTVSANDE
ncbi:bacterio-opsin activator domain-containing protein [Natronoarchaeum sp. GCM10025321]|uniref:bacterio-opsin activator domain-containing protein n=1 Tax=Natronoarchaeum sp. GCM10025321 TaxID=3252684 RepID=UPI003623E5AA